MPESWAVEVTLMLGRTPEEQISSLMKWGFTHFYNIWLVDVEEFGREEGKVRYQRVWEELFRIGFEGAKKALGVSGEIDIPTLGRIRSFMADSYPQVFDTVETSPDRYVGHIRWCPNPVYSVPDVPVRKAEYYRDEVDVTIHLAGLIVKWAGLEGKVAGKFTRAICLGDDVCEWVFEKEVK